MRLRGFTLIELMIALAIVAMLAGIVLPIGLSRLNADTFAQTQRQLESAVGIARADAQRRGVLMKLVAVESEGVTAIWSIEREAASQRGQGTQREFILELPAGTGIEPVPFATDDEEPGEGEEGEGEAERGGAGAAGAAAEGTPVERALCVLMPDGTVVPGEAMALRGRDGTRARIGFNAWTGALSFTILPREGADEDGPTELPPAAGEGG